MWLERLQLKWLWFGCAVLLALLMTLAALQYRWISQLSESDRRQRLDTLDRSIRNFRRDFTETVYDAMRTLRQSSALTPEVDLETGLRNFATLWPRIAERQRLLSAVGYGIISSDGKLVFKRLPVGGQQFAVAAWPSELAEHRQFLEKQMDEPEAEPPAQIRDVTGALIDGRPVILFFLKTPPEVKMPFGVPGSIRGWGMLELNADYLKTELIPELVNRYFGRGGFGQSGYESYQLAIVTGSKHQIVYQPEQSNFENFSTVDSRTAVFSQKVRPPPPGLNPARQGSPEGRRPPRDERPPPPDGRPPERRSANPPGSNGQIGPEPEFLIEPEDPDAWQLIVKYKSGSLEQTVNQTRWRNLISSFGTLLILSGSIALLAMAAFRARKLATQQMEFVAGVSHELRTPLAVIQSTSYNLAKGMISDGRRVQQYGEVIQNESRRLINQVEQMLSFAGIQSGRQHYDLRPERVEQIIERALAEYAAAFAASGWRVEQRIAAGLPMVLADNQSLESAIKNLLQNALKYAAGAKHLTITAEVAKNGVKKEVLITVADRGPGVDAADLPHIFKPFYRGKKVWDSPVTGTGLGLSLVERHLRAHGGRVTVKTSPETGTAFTLHLPALEKSETDSTL